MMGRQHRKSPSSAASGGDEHAASLGDKRVALADTGVAFFKLFNVIAVVRDPGVPERLVPYQRVRRNGWRLFSSPPFLRAHEGWLHLGQPAKQLKLGLEFERVRAKHF